MRLSIVTIGVYGFDEHGFFGRLKSAGVDTFCDIRSRRGVRGKSFAFANRRRLQSRLAALGIRYCHFRDLAPSRELRSIQAVADKKAGTTKRQRAELTPMFIDGYREQCLNKFNSEEFVSRLGLGARVIALFCVEREPAACHRSLVAERLRRDLGMEVQHLKPG